MSDPKHECDRPIGFTLPQNKPLYPAKKPEPARLGVELPFGWCLVRGEVLRRLQRELREARHTAGVRLRTCANLRREILRKDAR